MHMHENNEPVTLNMLVIIMLDMDIEISVTEPFSNIISLVIDCPQTWKNCSLHKKVLTLAVFLQH